MKTIKIPAEGYCSNCWVLIDEDSGQYALIDPSPDIEVIMTYLSSRELKKENLCYILLTHGHFDHILSLDELRNITGAPAAIHYSDAEFLTDPDKNAYRYFFHRDLTMRPAEILLQDGQRLQLGGTTVTVLHTPGHTGGSVCYLADGNIYSGDTLFDLGIGRTDLYSGSAAQLTESLKRLVSLSGDYRLYPGHGSVSTLEKQRAYNPYLRGL